MKKTIRESPLLLLALIGITAGIVWMLGKAPLYLEEPRRAIIALEMLHSGNLWAPTLFGEWYYKKPPLFNWLLLLFAGWGGHFHEFMLRLPTVLSTLAIAGLVYAAGKRHVHALFGARAALIFLTFASILLYFSALAEIDLFYSMLVFGSILAIEYWGERQRYWFLFLSVYLLCALGVLTKGLPSFAFTAISLLAFFLDKRRFGVLFAPPHIAGILLLAVLLGGYGWKYAQYNAPMYLLQTLVGESSQRTIAGNSLLALIKHIFLFPADLIKDMLPGAFLALFLIRRDLRQFLLERHPFIRFCTLMLLANLALYWLSPGTRIRYVYPLFPLAAVLLAWAYEMRREAPTWTTHAFHRVVEILLVLLAIGAAVLPFVQDLQFIPYLLPFSLALAMGFGLLWLWQRRRPAFSLAILFLAMALGRFLFDGIVFPLRAHNTEAQRNKALGMEIHRLTGDKPLYLYGEEKVISYTSSFYLNRLRRQPIRLQDQLQTGQFYLLPAVFITPRDSVLLETEYDRRLKALILRNVKKR